MSLILNTLKTISMKGEEGEGVGGKGVGEEGEGGGLHLNGRQKENSEAERLEDGRLELKEPGTFTSSKSSPLQCFQSQNVLTFS